MKEAFPGVCEYQIRMRIVPINDSAYTLNASLVPEWVLACSSFDVVGVLAPFATGGIGVVC